MCAARCVHGLDREPLTVLCGWGKHAPAQRGRRWPKAPRPTWQGCRVSSPTPPSLEVRAHAASFTSAERTIGCGVGSSEPEIDGVGLSSESSFVYRDLRPTRVGGSSPKVDTAVPDLLRGWSSSSSSSSSAAGPRLRRPRCTSQALCVCVRTWVGVEDLCTRVDELAAAAGASCSGIPSLAWHKRAGII